MACEDNVMVMCVPLSHIELSRSLFKICTEDIFNYSRSTCIILSCASVESVWIWIILQGQNKERLPAQQWNEP